MTTSSLFPDYAILENGRNEAQAMRLAQKLHEVDIHVLATDADRRMVTNRLRREGVDDVMQLLLLTEEEVATWYNVGPVFIAILAEMHAEVRNNPERIVDEWHNRHRLFVLPDDLRPQTDEGDFFGMLFHEGNNEHDDSSSLFSADAAEDCSQPISSAENAEDSTHAEIAASTSNEISEAISEIEHCLIAAIRMLENRWEHGIVLRKFFIEGMPTENIVSSCRLASSAALFRIIKKHFTSPLLLGYPTKGIQFSTNLLFKIKKVKKELTYAPIEMLEALERMVPARFLYFLDLTLLQQTTAEKTWSTDYIVKAGELQKCRRTQRDLFAALQWRVVSTKENAIRRSVHEGSVKFLRTLLKTHPCIENDRKGFRLVAERLTYDCARIARIVHDAHGPISMTEIIMRYERCYLERPQSLSLGNIRAHFPQVHSVRRGVWEWQ